MILSKLEIKKLQEISSRLGVEYNALYKLIKFESGFNPLVKNPYSSARGLIQFTNSTARSLGFIDSEDLIYSHPTIVDQLQVVEEYLSRYYPFKNNQSLYMSVFYPAYRNLDPNYIFPENVRSVNPGIKTIKDYVDKVEGKRSNGTMFVVAASVAALIYFTFKKKR